MHSLETFELPGGLERGRGGLGEGPSGCPRAALLPFVLLTGVASGSYFLTSFVKNIQNP